MIDRIYWLPDKGAVQELWQSEVEGILARLHKVVLIEREGLIILILGSKDESLDYHSNLLTSCALFFGWVDLIGAADHISRPGRDWSKANLRVLGGGTRKDDGTFENGSGSYGKLNPDDLHLILDLIGSP